MSLATVSMLLAHYSCISTPGGRQRCQDSGVGLFSDTEQRHEELRQPISSHILATKANERQMGGATYGCDHPEWAGVRVRPAGDGCTTVKEEVSAMYSIMCKVKCMERR